MEPINTVEALNLVTVLISSGAVKLRESDTSPIRAAQRDAIYLLTLMTMLQNPEQIALV